MPMIQADDLGNAVLDPDAQGGGQLVHPQFAGDIIKVAKEASASFQYFNSRAVPTGKLSIPVESGLPSAGWVDRAPGTLGATVDSTTKKPATSMAWKGVVLKLEELACFVPLVLADLEDAAGSGRDLWAEIRPAVGEAIAQKIDTAVFFGDDGVSGSKPASFPEGLVPAAIAAGHTHSLGGDVSTIPAQVNLAMEDIEQAGYDPAQFWAGVGFKGNLRGLTVQTVTDEGTPVTTTSNEPLYISDVRGDRHTGEIYNTPIRFCPSGAKGFWDPAVASALVGDPNYAILGTSREGMRVDMLKEATLDVSAARDGSEVINLAQQGMVALRLTFRMAFATANPVTVWGDSGYAFSAVTPS